jgi:hypothetical protein
MALTTALALAAGCKTESSAPAAGGDTTKPAAGGEVKPPPPSLPDNPANADDPAAQDGRRGRGPELDKDGDSGISEARAANLKARAEMMRKRLDADGDGKLTPAELANARGRMRFEDPGELDTNRDGDISADELVAGMKVRAEKRRAQLAGSGGSGGSGASGASGASGGW